MKNNSLKLVTLCMLLLLTSIAKAQQSSIYTNDYRDFNKALALYNNKQYKVSQALFETIKYNTQDSSIKADCAFYIANCAIRLNQKNADDLVKQFVEDYPTNTKQNTAFLNVADYYFDNAKYAYARKWYQRVNQNGINNTEKERFNFNYGYSLYATKNKKQAKKYLNRVVNSKTYGSQAKYYIGFMAYEGDDYDTATDYFNQVADNEKYKEKLSYYQADLNFKLGKFNEAIALAKAQLTKSNTQETSELSKIIGESYFNLKNYKEALPYLKAYKGKNGKWNNTDYYQLGYAYYKQNNFELAISEFNKIIDGRNAVAQNAYYHLGESYINLNKKSEALNAFKNASEMNFDSKIKEDAWLNYAKISYEIGNPYQSVPQVLTNYLQQYPKSNNRNTIETLLIDSYITSKNYKEALALLKGKTSFQNKAAYQKVAYFRALELYNETKYQQALDLFKKSIKTPINPKFEAKATFWKAECEYHLGNYNDALLDFKYFEIHNEAPNTSEVKNLNYNLAYTYFKLKKYDKASAYFNKFISTTSNDALRKNDAYLRLGDGYFVTSDYKKAIDAYNSAIKINAIESDYASFQMAMSHGYLGNTQKKQKSLAKVIKTYNNSALRDDAIYELANSYVKTNNNEKALQRYDQLRTNYPNSTFIPKALLRQGLLFYNTNNNTKALNKFKTVAKTYPNSPEAIQAVSSARLIYIDLGQVDAYANWVKTLNYINVTNVELDNAMYLAAEKPYLDNDADKAIRQFNKYLNQFPKGINTLKSHFYLAQLYYGKNLFDNALPHYTYVVEASKNEYTEQALLRLSEIVLAEKNWTKAISLLNQLNKQADYPQNKLYAQSNLMKAYYETKNFTKAVTYAETILKTTKLDPKIKNDAQLIIARSAIKTNNESKAKTAYKAVEASATGEIMAEALYYDAYFKNKEKNFKASNSVIKKLAKNYSSYKYYSAKGLLLMANNFYELDDAFQATYILESVIANFTQFNDVVTKAKTQLNLIKTKEAKTNASVETKN